MTLVVDLSGTSRRLVCDQTLSGRVGSGRVAVVGFGLYQTLTFPLYMSFVALQQSVTL